MSPAVGVGNWLDERSMEEYVWDGDEKPDGASLFYIHGH